MPSKYHRNKPQGLLHRTKLRVLVVPKLALGQPIPSSSELARLLLIHPSEAGRHMRRVLDEDGYVTWTEGKGPARRTYVVALPAGSMAA